jgi:hypothetical protein
MDVVWRDPWLHSSRSWHSSRLRPPPCDGPDRHRARTCYQWEPDTDSGMCHRNQDDWRHARSLAHEYCRHLRPVSARPRAWDDFARPGYRAGGDRGRASGCRSRHRHEPRRGVHLLHCPVSGAILGVAGTAPVRRLSGSPRAKRALGGRERATDAPTSHHVLHPGRGRDHTLQDMKRFQVSGDAHHRCNNP